MQNVMQLNHPRLDVEGQAFEDEVFNLTWEGVILLYEHRASVYQRAAFSTQQPVDFCPTLLELGENQWQTS